MGRPCLNKGGEQRGGRWKPVTDRQGEGGARDQLEQTDLINREPVEPESVDRQKDGDEAIQSLEFCRLITGYKEPGDPPYDHIDITCHSWGHIDLDTTQNRLCLVLLYERCGSGSERGQEGATARPFALPWIHGQNSTAAFGECSTESDLVDRVQIRSFRDLIQRSAFRVGAPGLDEFATGFLGRRMTNRGKSEIAESDKGESEIIEHGAHLVDDLDHANNILLVQGLEDQLGNGTDDLRVIDLGWSGTGFRGTEEAGCQVLEQNTVGLEEGGVFGRDLDRPDDTLRIAIPLAAGLGSSHADFTVPERTEEVEEFRA